MQHNSGPPVYVPMFKRGTSLLRSSLIAKSTAAFCGGGRGGNSIGYSCKNTDITGRNG